MYREHEYEKKVISIFETIGYNYITSEEMICLRKDLSTIIIYEQLENNIKRINKGINQTDVNAVIDKVKRMDNADLIEGNKQAMDTLKNGVKVYNQIDDKTNTYRLIDFDNINNNEFVVTDQLKLISNHSNYTNQIPDLVVYINGIPISVIELKSPLQTDDLKSSEDAFDQIKNYQVNMPYLFTWNIINTISNMSINRYGSLTSPYSRFSNWRNLKQEEEYPYKYFFENLYDKNTILSILREFSFYTIGNNPKKIVAGYHQIIGVNEAKLGIIESMDTKSGKAGIFWHTQGSGKSFSMVFLTRIVNNIKNKMTTIVITDRRDLDEQLSKTFEKASGYLNQDVKQIASITDLKDTLNNKIQNGIYLCTVQKFNDTVGKLSDREDILVITDEAHRSHKNIHGKLEVVDAEVKEKFGYAYYLRKAFPKAAFMGFTGTPIESEDHQTKEVFGGYATKYLMTDATEDGFVVPISYESRHAKLEIASEKKLELDEIYDELREEILDKVELKAEVQKNLNKKIQKMDMIIGDKTRIKEIAKDFVSHYKARSNLLKGKAMFVAYNRTIAYNYYKEIIKLDPSLKDKIRLILTANNQKDDKEMLELIKTDKYRKDSADVFKDANSNFKIAIVVDMWLTGFDAPSLDTIYLDKPIKMHNLMQTIARVNRTYTDDNNKNLYKENGLVVDYIGLWKKLEDALEFYTTGGDNIKESGPKDIDILKIQLLKYVDHIYKDDLQKMIKIDFTKTANKAYLFEIIEDIQRIIFKTKSMQQFVNKTKKLTKGFTSVITACSHEEKTKIQLLITTRSLLIKREIGRVDMDFKVNEIKELIADSIIHNKTVISDSIKGDEISLTNIINYITKVNPKEEKDPLEVEKISKATSFAIKSLRKLNLVKSEKLTSKLQILLDKYDSNHISIEDFLEGLLRLGEEIRTSQNEFNNSDKSVVELAFFEIMQDDEYSQNQFDKDMIEKITKELYNKVKPLLNKRWLYNESIKQRVRSEMKKILIANDYPKEKSDVLQKKLIKQLQMQIHNGICRLED